MRTFPPFPLSHAASPSTKLKLKRFEFETSRCLPLPRLLSLSRSLCRSMSVIRVFVASSRSSSSSSSSALLSSSLSLVVVPRRRRCRLCCCCCWLASSLPLLRRRLVSFRLVSSSVVSVFGHRSLPSFSCSSSSLLATEPGAAGGAAVQRIRQNFNSLRPTASRQPVEVLSRRRRQRPSTHKDDCGGDCSQSNHSDDSQSK